MSKLIGRPPTYDKDVIRKTRQYFETFESSYDSPVTRTDKDGNVTEVMVERPNKPPSIRKFAKFLNVSRETIYEWKRKHKEFSDTFDDAYLETMKECFLDNASLDLYNAGFSKFVMQNICGWSDKTQNDSTIKHEFPTKITIEIVRPKDAPANS